MHNHQDVTRFVDWYLQVALTTNVSAILNSWNCDVDVEHVADKTQLVLRPRSYNQRLVQGASTIGFRGTSEGTVALVPDSITFFDPACSLGPYEDQRDHSFSGMTHEREENNVLPMAPSTNTSSDDSLSGGVIAGLVCASVAVVGAIVALVYLKHKQHKLKEAAAGDILTPDHFVRAHTPSIVTL
jgi:hypothetical protein